MVAGDDDERRLTGCAYLIQQRRQRGVRRRNHARGGRNGALRRTPASRSDPAVRGHDCEAAGDGPRLPPSGVRESGAVPAAIATLRKAMTAGAAWKKAVELDATNYDALYNLATTLARDGRMAEVRP